MNFADFIPTILFSVIIVAAIMKLNDKFTIRYASMVLLGLSLTVWLVANIAYNTAFLPRLYSDNEIKAQDLYDMFTMSKVERDSIIDLKANSINPLTKKRKAIDSIFVSKNEGKSYTLIMQSQQDCNRILGRFSGNQIENKPNLYKVYAEKDSFYVKNLGLLSNHTQYALLVSKSLSEASKGNASIKSVENIEPQKKKRKGIEKSEPEDASDELLEGMSKYNKERARIGKDASEDFEEEKKIEKAKNDDYDGNRKKPLPRNERALPPPPPPYKPPTTPKKKDSNELDMG